MGNVEFIMAQNSESLLYDLGGGTYVLMHKKAKRWMLPTGLVIAMGVLIGSISAGFSNEMFSSAFWIIPSVLIVPTVAESTLPTWSPMVKIGNISFELFLIHELVLRYSNAILGHIGVTESLWRSIAVAVTVFAISVVAALMFRRLKRRFSERKLINESISK